MTYWGDVNARVRGDSLHFLSDEALREIAQADGLSALAERIAAAPNYTLLRAASGTLRSIDRYLRDAVQMRVALLVRWLGDRRAQLRVLFLDEDRRGLRYLVRSLQQGISDSGRAAGTTPSPTLTSTDWRRLLSAADVDELGPHLQRAGHPFAAVLLNRVTVAGASSSFEIETELARCFAQQCRRAADHSDVPVRIYVHNRIDLENAWSAIATADQGDAVSAETLFLQGGEYVTHDVFADACRADTADEAWQVVQSASPVLREARTDTSHGLANEFDRALAKALWNYQRREPLSCAILLWYWVRLLGELRDLRRAAWGVALQQPAGAIGAEMGGWS